MQTDQFHPEKLLASGPAAKVYRGVENATGRKVLIKALLSEHETPHALDRERLQLFAPALMQMRHPQITGLITLLPTEEEFAIVSEFMPGDNIRTLAATRQVSAADLRALAVQFMHALLAGEHLRQPHGDPKPSNVIIADHPGGGMFLQLQDWGLSLTRRVHPAETLWFRAPELHLGGMPTSQSDLFTAAASLFCLATNTDPVHGELGEHLMQQWQTFNPAYVLQHMRPDLDQPLRDWLCWLLQIHPQQRPQCVAQALDMLMGSMHTGFIYMPQQAPQMMPGAQTTPLIPAAAPTPPPVTVAAAAPVAQASAPKARPITPKATPIAQRAVAVSVYAADDDVPVAVAVIDDEPPPAKKKKGSTVRVLVAVSLNLSALVLLGFFLWPAISGAQMESKPHTATATRPAPAPPPLAAPAAAIPEPAPKAPVPAPQPDATKPEAVDAKAESKIPATPETGKAAGAAQ